jgi:hypothetical protein
MFPKTVPPLTGQLPMRSSIDFTGAATDRDGSTSARPIDLTGTTTDPDESTRARRARIRSEPQLSNRNTRGSCGRTFFPVAASAWPGRAAISARSGICASDALAMSLDLGASFTFLTVQGYVLNNPVPPGCRHITAAEWEMMGSERITKWKTDVDFFWVAALAFGVCVYVWSVEQGTRVFTPAGDPATNEL